MYTKFVFLRPMRHRDYPTQIWNSHSLYCTRLLDEFQIIKKFLNTYPSEVVIIFLNGGWLDIDDNLYQTMNNELDM